MNPEVWPLSLLMASVGVAIYVLRRPLSRLALRFEHKPAGEDDVERRARLGWISIPGTRPSGSAASS